MKSKFAMFNQKSSSKLSVTLLALIMGASVLHGWPGLGPVAAYS